ncbi:hypothetical protein [Taibaiella soli]|nr:hypothetical protein [Taibaiella soli]
MKSVNPIKSVATILRPWIMVCVSLIMLWCSSCKDCRCDDHHTLRDSLVLDYFKDYDDGGYYRMGERDYKFFKAYYRNDTASLRDFQQTRLESLRLDSMAKSQMNIIGPPGIDSIDADEIFQLSYGNSTSGKLAFDVLVFCRKSDTAILVYTQYLISGRQLDKKKEERKYLPLQDWYDFDEFARHHEFWDLTPIVHSGCGFYKESIGIHWTDRGGKRTHTVVRMTPQRWSIFELFTYLLKKGGWYESFAKEFIVPDKKHD